VIKRYLSILALVTLTSTGMAANESIVSANQITLKNNDTVQVKMSSNMINRLYVNDDTISNVNCPAGMCEITSNKDDPNGSLYLKLKDSDPFTYYVSTKNGYHFGVRVTPKKTKIGDTLAFSMIGGNSKSDQLVNSSNYSQQVIKDMSVMVKDKSGTHFYKQFIKATKSNTLTLNGVRIAPLYHYQGQKMAGFVSLLTNINKQTVKISEPEFYVTGNRAIALSKHQLKPNEHAYLYVLK
jgi:type-F conjugative transfer system secretin TraK